MPTEQDVKFSDFIRGLPAASEADLAAGNNMPLVLASGVNKLPAELVIAGDGSLRFSSLDFRQYGDGIILSGEFIARKNDNFSFNGGEDGPICKLLALRGTTYVTLVESSSTFSYTLNQNDKIYIHLSKTGITPQDYNADWMTFYHAISVNAINGKLDTKLANSLYASKDGKDFVPADVFHYQTSTGRILSSVFAFKNGSAVYFNSNDANVVCNVLRRQTPTSGSYTTIASGSSFVYKFTQDEDAIFFSIGKADGTPFNISDFVEGSLVVYNIMSAKNIEELSASLVDVSERVLHPDFIAGPFAAKDGLFTLDISKFVQTGAKVLSKSALSFESGMSVVFDGTADGTFGYILRRQTPTSGTFATIASGSKFTYKFDEDEDTIFFNVKKEDDSPLNLDDFNPATYKLYSQLNVERIEDIEAKVASVEPSAIPYYAYVKNGKLVAGQIESNGGRWATYLACEMPARVNYIGCKWYWEGAQAEKGTIALAAMPDTWNKKISGNDGITGKSLHLTVTPTKLKVDFLGDAWGEYYYTNLINVALALDTSASVEHALSLTISGETISVALDGTTYTGINTSDKSMTDVVGKYCFVEHYAGAFSPATIDMPAFTAFRVSDEANNILFDAFQRENGVPTMSPQGFKYISLSNDRRYSENNPNSYPNW